MSNIQLTSTQWEVYSFVAKYIQQNGIAPSHREIREAVSIWDVGKTLRELDSLEVLYFTPKLHRGISL